MKTLSTGGGVKIQAAVLIYMLNLQKGKNFLVECNEKKLMCTSGDNELVKFRNGNHREYAVRVTSPEQTKYFVEPFRVESFPDDNHVLSFHCKNALISNK